MSTPYTTVADFKAWIPQRYLAELSNDTNGFTPDDTILQDALERASALMDSKLRVRDDIPIPAIDSDGNAPIEIIECIHDLAIYILMKRRATMTDTIRENFDIQMTWLNDIVMRRANIDITINNVEKTKTSERIGYGGINRPLKNKFDHFTF